METPANRNCTKSNFLKRHVHFVKNVAKIQLATLSSQNGIIASNNRRALLALNTLPHRRCHAAASKPALGFSPQELQILISAEQETQTRFTARCVTVGLVRNLIILVWGYKIIIIMSTVFLHVTAIKNKLQLIPSRTSCWRELYKFLIHSRTCINLISHVPQKKNKPSGARTCARSDHNCWAKVIAQAWS